MPWIDYVAAGGSATLISGGLGGLILRHMRHVAAVVVHDIIDVTIKDISSDIKDLALKFAKETGGNNNGLRQAVNSIAQDVAHLKGTVEQMQTQQGK